MSLSEQLGPLKELVARLKKGPTDVVGIDVGTTATKAVRMRINNDQITLSAADIFPPINTKTDESDKEGGDSPAAVITPLSLPPKFKARYACVSITAPRAIVKLLSFPGQIDAHLANRIVESMGIKDPDQYRLGYKVVSEGHGRAESRVLAVALPEDQAAILTGILPSGIPAPYSLEVSGLATVAAFLHAAGSKHDDEAIGLIDFGADMSTFALFAQSILVLIRRFDFGTNPMLEQIRENLGVDRETAQGILADGSFDISQSVTTAMEPLMKQLMISRDFVERRENCRVSRLYVSGGLVSSRYAIDELNNGLGIDVENWNPFDELTVTPDAMPGSLAGQEWRFAGAIGACLGTFEET